MQQFNSLFISNENVSTSAIHSTLSDNESDNDIINFQLCCLLRTHRMSDEVVIVEVPTRDGIEHEEDDVTILHSQCIPRMSVYIIFPIAVLVLVLSCAFI